MVEWNLTKAEREAEIFIGDLIELIRCYEKTISDLKAQNSSTEELAQNLQEKLSNILSDNQGLEQNIAETVYAFFTSALQDGSPFNDNSNTFTDSNAVSQLPIYNKLLESIDMYKGRMQDNLESLQQRLNSMIARAENAEANNDTIAESLRSLGKEIAPVMEQIAAQGFGSNSSTINSSIFSDETATISALLADFASSLKGIAEYTTHITTRLMQLETELQFYKNQAATRADSEQKTLEELSKQSSINEKLRKETTESHALISDLQTGLFAKNAEIAELHEELNSLTKSLAVEQEKTANLNKEFVALNQEYLAVQASLTAEQSRVSAMSSVSLQMEKLQSDLRTATAELTKLRAENRDMQDTMAFQTDMIRQLNEKLTETVQQKDNLATELRETVSANQAYHCELQQCKEQLDMGNMELHNTITNLTKELESTQKKHADTLAQMQQELTDRAIEREEMQVEIGQLQASEKILTANLRDCEAELTRVQELNIALQTDIVDISQEKEQIKERSSADERLISDRLDKMQQALTEKFEAEATLHKRIEDLTADVRVREEMMANCEEEIGRLDAMNVTTTEKLHLAFQQIEELKTLLAEKERLVESANATLVNATSDMENALKSAENAFTDKYLKTIGELKAAQVNVADLESKLSTLQSEFQLVNTNLEEKNAELANMQKLNNSTLQDKDMIIETLQASLLRRDDASSALSAQNEQLSADMNALKMYIKELEDEIHSKADIITSQEERIQGLLVNGCDLQNEKISEQNTTLEIQQERIHTLKGDLSNVEYHLSELDETANNILNLLANLALDTSRSMVEISKISSQSIMRAASMTGSLALSTLSGTKPMSQSRYLPEIAMKQRDSEAALAIERVVRLEETIIAIQDRVEHISVLTKQRLDEVCMLHERIEVKEKEVNMLLDLTKSREDRINVLLEEVNNKNAIISEQSEMMDRMMKDPQMLQSVL